MSLIDFILNVAGLLLWLNWRAWALDPLARTTPATLAGTLRRTGSTRLRRWHFLLALAGLLVIRALFYWQLGPALNWTAGLNLIATRLPFQSDFFSRMLLYSALSFARLLFIFLLWLLLLSLLNRETGAGLALTRHLRLHLGPVDRWPWPVKLLLPFLAGAALWWVLNWALATGGLAPRPPAVWPQMGQAALVGVGAYLAWKYLIVGLLLLHWLNTYVHFGRHPVWDHVHALARRLLWPLKPIPLRVGKADFAPIVAMAVVFLVAQGMEHGLRTPGWEIPGLQQLFEWMSR